MAKTVLELRKKDKNNKQRTVGSIEIKNQTEQSADLYFYGDINSESLGEWQKYYPEDKAPKDVQDFLNQLENVSVINIYINSGGGSVFGGIAICNILERYDAETVAHVDALAASIAGVIAMAADRVIIPANAQLMMHKPSSYTWGNADDMRRQAEILDGCQKIILKTYMKHAKEGVTEEQINDFINAETWKNGEEWQEYFDIEVSEKNLAAACSSEYYDKYSHLPESLKKEPTAQEIDIDRLADILTQRISDSLKKVSEQAGGKEPEPQNNEKENQIAAILEDLDLI